MNVPRSDKPQEAAELRDILMVQCPICVDRPAANRQVISDLLANDSVPAGSLIVLPELCTTGLPTIKDLEPVRDVVRM